MLYLVTSIKSINSVHPHKILSTPRAVVASSAPAHSLAHPPQFAQSSTLARHGLFRGIRISLAGLK